MNPPSCLRILLLVAIAVLVAACGGSDDDAAKPKAPVKQVDPIERFDVAESSDGTTSVVGRPVRATETEIVVANADGDELAFEIREQDAASVDVGHVSSHIGIQDLAFRVYFEDVDGTLFALAAEEVSASEL